MPSKYWFLILKISVFFICIGRAYQIMFFGAPFRAIFWDESFMAPIVEYFTDYSWFEYATSLKVNYWIEFFTKICSFLLLVGAITALFWEKINMIRFKKGMMYTCITILIFLAICISKDKNYDVLQLFELFIQISIPVSLLLIKQGQEARLEKIKIILKVALSVTFIAHGLFAIGFIYYPANFVDMTIGILGLTETQAKVFLTIAGILDIIVALLIYYPKTIKIALIYALIWGLLTAFARVVFGYNQIFLLDSIHDSLYSTIYRLPHGLIAGIILLIMLKISEEKIEEKSNPISNTNNNLNPKTL
jgi:hypothetical protein